MKTKCCNTHLSEKEVLELLTENGISRTKIKTQILLTLAESKEPLSATAIHQEIGQDNCNISTVWRGLKQFHEKGIVSEVNLGEDFFRYELKSLSKDQHHHHHVRCRNCGAIRHLEECDISEIERKISKLGFKDLEHSLEFTGLCSKCGSKRQSR